MFDNLVEVFPDGKERHYMGMLRPAIPIFWCLTLASSLIYFGGEIKNDEDLFYAAGLYAFLGIFSLVCLRYCIQHKKVYVEINSEGFFLHGFSGKKGVDYKWNEVATFRSFSANFVTYIRIVPKKDVTRFEALKQQYWGNKIYISGFYGKGGKHLFASLQRMQAKYSNI